MQRTAWSICNPTTNIKDNNLGNQRTNLWNWIQVKPTTTSNDNPVVKSIYDPSPVGYSMPPGNVFTGLSDNRWIEDSKTRVPNSSYSNAFEVYCDMSEKNPENTFLLPLGSYLNDGSLSIGFLLITSQYAYATSAAGWAIGFGNTQGTTSQVSGNISAYVLPIREQ